MRSGVALLSSIALVLAAVGAPPARADEADGEGVATQGRVVIDRVEVLPSRLGLTRLRALISAVDLNGHLIPTTAATGGKKTEGLKLKLGGADVSQAMLGTFESSDAELALVILVPVTYDFETYLEPIRDRLKSELLTPLGKLGPRVQVAVLGFAEGTTGSRKLGNVAAAVSALDKLEIDSTAPALLPAVQRAVTMVKNAVKKPRNPGAMVRGAVVVISDGMGVSTEERAAITKLGQAARKDSVRIHTLAFSPSSHKRPLFHLGELAKQSQGTFRWVRTDEGWTARTGQLLAELKGETMLTLFGAPEQLADKKLVVTVPLAGKLLESEPVKLPSPVCGGEACDGYCHKAVCVLPLRAKQGGALTWILIAGGGAVGLLAVVGGVLAMRRRRVQPGVAGGAPGLPPMPGLPGLAGGAPLPGSFAPAPVGPAAAMGPAAIAPGTPILTVLSGPQTGQRLALRHGFTLGKAPGSDLDLSHDGFASTNHAMITFDGATWTLVDRGSTNGTFVQGNRVSQVRLDPGLTVRLGATDVVFSYA